MPKVQKKKVGGRPPKFQEPRHPVTMTLPERILNLLSEIDPDRAQAVVKATMAVSGGNDDFKFVELVEMAPGQSLIVIGPCQALRQIHWVSLIEIAPTRLLLTLPSGTPIEGLEVAVRDLVNDPKWVNHKREYAILHELLNLIGNQRRSKRLSKAELLIINTR